jgi:hypothetical protein
VRRIMRLCNCLWGGRYNPIIPYFEDITPRQNERHYRLNSLNTTRGYINFFEPDLLVESAEGMADELGWTHDDKYLDLPRLVTLDNFFEHDIHKRVEFAAGCDIFYVISHLYDLEYKYERRHKVPFALWEPGEHDPFFELFGGMYPEDDALAEVVPFSGTEWRLG